MLKYFVLFGILLISMSPLFASEIQVRKLQSFNKISVENDVTINLIHSDKNRATIKVDGVPLDDVVTEVSGFEILIKLKKYYPNTSVTIDLEYNSELEKIETTHATAGVNCNGVIYSDSKFEIDASFGGHCYLNVSAKEVKITAGQGSRLNVYGTTELVEIYSYKDSYINCLNLTYIKIKQVNTGGEVKVLEK